MLKLALSAQLKRRITPLVWITPIIVWLSACAPEPLALGSGQAVDLERGGVPSEGGGLEQTLAGGEPSGALEGGELEGLWRATVVTTTVMSLPVVMQELTTTLTAELSLDVRQEGERLWVSARTCSVQSVSEPDIGQRVIPSRFIEALGPIEREGRVWRDRGQLQLELPRAYELRGVRLDEPSVDPLPTSADDPRVIDLDRDGHPGLTVTLTGFPSGDVYLVQRTWDEWRGWSEGEGEAGLIDRVVGEVSWGEEQSRLGATSEALLLDVPQQIPEGEGLQVFEMTRVSEGEAGCP